MNETLNSVRSRPRFKIKTKISPQEFSKNLKLRIKGYDNFEGSVNQETAIIYIKTKTTPYWKPQLSLRTELNTEENITEITGVFGPSSSVWTFFMFLYFILGIGFMVFFSFYFVSKQINSDSYNWALYASLGVLVLLGLLYLSSIIGKKLAKREMDLLRLFAENTLIPLEKDS